MQREREIGIWTEASEFEHSFTLNFTHTNTQENIHFVRSWCKRAHTQKHGIHARIQTAIVRYQAVGKLIWPVPVQVTTTTTAGTAVAVAVNQTADLGSATRIH